MKKFLSVFTVLMLLCSSVIFMTIEGKFTLMHLIGTMFAVVAGVAIAKLKLP
jgi:hypothetical protein